MNVNLQSQPAPGSTHPGDLYVDLQSRQLWLGVDPAVDPNESVLVSDMLALQAADTTTLNSANAYTDSQITTRAPTVHTHTAAQITDFNSAVTSVVLGIPGFNWIRGMILQWSGSLAEIGVGDLAGWSLCDGSNGTPDLRDKFIFGAGNLAVGDKNATPIGFTTSLDGNHTHIVGGTVLTTTMLPPHTHTLSVFGSGTFTSGTESANHTHGVGDGQGAHVSISGSGAYGAGASSQIDSSGRSVAHTHNTTVSLTSTGTSGNGPGTSDPHTHTLTNTGQHQHSVTPSQIRAAIPWFALAFIMKL